MAMRTNVQYIRFYTEGSAARKLEPVVPLNTMKLPKVKKNKRRVIFLDPMAVAGMAMAVVMAVLMVVGIVQLNKAQQEVETLSGYVQTLREENVQLEQTFSESYDVEEIRQTALALGMVPVEEVEHVTLRMPEVQEPEEPTAWERFTTFLTGLFA